MDVTTATDSTPIPTLDAVPLADLAVRWNCSISTIRRKIRAGILPVIRFPGSSALLIPSEAIIDAERPRTMANSSTASPTS